MSKNGAKSSVGMRVKSDDARLENEAGLIFQHVARQRIKLLDAFLLPHGLTSAQVYLLNWLLREDGRTQIELARLLNIGTVAVSGMVDRLEAADWVERRADQADRRTKRVFLKASAMSKKHVLSEAAAQVNALSFADMTDAEVDQLLSLMRRVRRNLNGALTGDMPPLAAPGLAQDPVKSSGGRSSKTRRATPVS